jgi:hypothetical protein
MTVVTETPLSSQNAQVGQSVITRVTDSVAVEGYTVIPAGSRIEGVVSLARAATSRESGMVGVEFNRLVLTNGRSVPIVGKLTSLDPAERRHIDAQTDARVVFVGGRRGTGAAIGAIGSGSSNDPVSGVLGALGTLLSKGADVTVPVNTPLAVQLESGVTLTGQRTGYTDPSEIYTTPTSIRAAQLALRARNYYSGAIDGRMTNATRRALFEFQLDNELYATGNLDRVTAEELGLNNSGGTVGNGGLSQSEAALVTRNAQSLNTTWRNAIGVNANGRLDPRRTYFPAELEAYFALSAFSDNASLYDQMIRSSTNPEGIRAAGLALMASARRVDAAMQGLNVPSRIINSWRTIQSQLRVLDTTY